MQTEDQYRIAVLIDAENVDPSYADQIFTYANSLGIVTVREIYGSGTSLNEWADPILVHSIHTNFTLRPNRFKNSSDICLVIGAMEILAASRLSEKDRIAAVVIASSDSDFSPLAVHLRSADMDVIGMGEPGHFNPLWPRACTDFIPLEANAPLMRKRESASPEVPVPAEKETAPDSRAAQKEAASATRSSDAAPRAEKRSKSLKEKKPVSPKTAQSESAVSDAPPAEARKQAGLTADLPAQPSPEESRAADAAPEEKSPAEGAKKSRPKEAKASSGHAPTHKARAEIIRQFMADQILSRGERIKSGDLFRALNTLPDYKYDQQRSRRNPLDYLNKQYSEWFVFEPGENGSSWISLKTPPERPAGEAPSLPEAAASGEVRLEEEPQAELPAEAASSPAIPDIPEPSEEKNQDVPSSDAQLQKLTDAGIPAVHAAQAADILSRCRNLRDSYNHLRKAFGNETGKKYQDLIKAARIPLGKSPSREKA